MRNCQKLGGAGKKGEENRGINGLCLLHNFIRGMPYSEVLYPSYSIPYRFLPQVENEICTHNHGLTYIFS